jgi:hypothetical protein
LDPQIEASEEDLGRSEYVKLRMEDITRKEELLRTLDRTVNKWRKRRSINETKKKQYKQYHLLYNFSTEKMLTLILLQEMYLRFSGKKIVTTIRVKSNILQSIIYSVTN